MKKGLKIGAASLAALLVFGAAGCSVSDKDGKAWAEENGYVKYVDSDAFTSASVKPSSYIGMYEKEEALQAAMNKYKGTYLHTTINPDGTTHTAFFIYSIKKNTETNKWEISQSFGVNADGTPNQTTANLLREGRGTAVFSSHSYGELVATPTYTAVTGATAPTWAANTYYSKVDNRYTLTTAAPADWATTYTSYYTMEYTDVHKADLKADAEHNVAVAAQMYYTVKSYEKTEKNGQVTGYKFVLEIQECAPIS